MKMKFEAKDTKLNYTLNVVSRWIVGLVFLFSAFVKGVDPMGTMFIIEDYMSSWSLFGSSFEWAYPLAGVCEEEPSSGTGHMVLRRCLAAVRYRRRA